MDKIEKTYVNVLKRNGTNQTDRLMPALLPESVSLHAFNLNDWMNFTQNFARSVHFYNQENAIKPSTSWEFFFKNTTELQTFLAEIEDKNPEEIGSYLAENDAFKQITPHLSLFITFLKLLKLAKNRFNELTSKHLDFYFLEILKLQKKPLRSDEAHILFELAHGVKQVGIAAGTLFAAGEDKLGNKRIYELKDEIAVNRIKIGEMKSIYRSFDADSIDNTDEDHAFKAAPVAASQNGLGLPLKGAYTSWYPFGYYQKQSNFPYAELPDAKIGYSLSSAILLAGDGDRTLDFNFEFESLQAQEQDVAHCFFVYFTGEKNWFKKDLELSSKLNGNLMVLKAHFSEADEAICAYNPEIHGGAYRTDQPLVRFEVRCDLKDGRNVYTQLISATLNKVEIHLKVQNSKALQLSSDQSELKSDKAFSPFGSNPIKGAAFYIGHQEAFQKKLTYLNILMDWKNTPANFPAHYDAYAPVFQGSISQKQLTDEVQKTGKTIEEKRIVKNDSYFKIKIHQKVNEIWSTLLEESVLFDNTNGLFQTHYSIQTENEFSSIISHFDQLKFTLKQSFLQELFARVFAMAMSDTSKNSPIPKEPYQPLAENILLSYNAVEKISFKDPSASNEILFFHEYPFGLLQTDTREKYLFPRFDFGGELYIGLTELEKGEQLSLLIQVDEGSENPLSKSFALGEKIEWYVLCSNTWNKLESNLMILNQTDNFLKSGLLRVVIPDAASDDNTILPDGSYWIKAVCNKSYDTVSKVIGIYPQAALVKLQSKTGDLSYLDAGLPANSISVMVNRNPLVKSITQPFNAVGGRTEEQSSVFYRRVSERLHHKNRLVSLWDYERIVLEEFPEVYRVKCLNHTKGDCYESPGSVSLVVIPDTRKKNAFDPFEPRFSTAMLNKIRNFMLTKKTPQVDVFVINPEYEVVEIEITVKFNPNLDENLYAIQLNEDLIKYLSPWAFDTKKELAFGIKLHRNAVLFYIENLSYVDYISELNMYQNAKKQAVFCSAETPKSILVSAKKHRINQKQPHLIEL